MSVIVLGTLQQLLRKTGIRIKTGNQHQYDESSLNITDRFLETAILSETTNNGTNIIIGQLI